MSLYNTLFGMNPDSNTILSLLGKTAADFGRFRNVYLEDGCIVVHTRNGGGNREDYEAVFDEMSSHPWFVRDEDDDFDCTYANFYFKLPEEKFAEISTVVHPGQNPAEQWQALLTALNS